MARQISPGRFEVSVGLPMTGGWEHKVVIDGRDGQYCSGAET
jgi:hypothetical protein